MVEPMVWLDDDLTSRLPEEEFVIRLNKWNRWQIHHYPLYGTFDTREEAKAVVIKHLRTYYTTCLNRLPK